MQVTEQSPTHRTGAPILPATKDRVSGFLANIENLPAWATEFCQELKRDGAHYKVVTSGGELFFRVESDPKTGVIDMFAGPTLTAQSIFPCRVITLPGHGIAVSFTFFHPPGVPNELYERQHASLLVEMDGLAERFSSAG